jgi:uncharacterized membrane protein YphA (DoxX/SURF4 family)
MMFRHDQSELIRGESPQRVYTRARAVLLSVCVAMLIGVGASVPLWSSDVERRSELVTVPVFAFMGTLPAWFELVLLLVWLVSVLFVALLLGVSMALGERRVHIATVWQRARTAAICATVPLVLLLLFDQLRWQPWIYQYLIMLLAVVLAPRGSPSITLDAWRLLVAAMLWWAGWQKVNCHFVDIFISFVSPIVPLVPSFVNLRVAALFAPWFELALGPGLLWPRTRRFATAAAVAMFIFNVLILSPLAGRHNWPVMPWNSALAFMIGAMFADTPWLQWRDVLWPRTPNAAHRLVFALMVVAPALSFVNLWDSLPAMSLYSGTNSWSRLIIKSEAAAAKLPDAVRRHLDDDMALSPGLWARNDLGMPHYPELRVFRRMFAPLCSLLEPHEADVLFQQRLAFYAPPEDAARISCAAFVQGRSIEIE